MTGSRSLFESFESLARNAPAAAALREPGIGLAWTRDGLLREACGLARTLRQGGFRARDVALVHASGTSFVVALLAVWSLDGVAIAADAQLTDQELAALGRAFAPNCRIGGVGGDPRVHRTRNGAPHCGLRPDATVIKLTSGSTGEPRGIAVSADQLRADANHIIAGMGITPEDANVAAIPLSHSYGLGNLLLPLIVQGSPLLLVSRPLPDVLAGVLSGAEPLVFPGVPYLLDLLARPGAPTVRRRGLRLCISAGAPLPSRTALAFSERYGVPARSFYGTTETGGVCFDASPDGNAASALEGCVGTPLPAVEVTVRGAEGRVVVRSASVASGYAAAHGECAEGGFGDCEFMTDDVGRFDSAGRLHLVGRLAGRVNVCGRKVDPREIELAVSEIAGVSEALVAGIPDERRGQSLVAYLVAAPRLTRSEVLAHLRSKLASWKIPREIVFLDALPRNARGKLDRRALAAASRGHHH